MELIYEGQWLNGKKHGRGLEVDMTEGSFYIGEWRANLKEGYGRLVLESGNVYEGWWSDSVAHGPGES